ncbi:MAG: phenylalanine--tRNA ligase subunit beta [Lentisphaeria bacterium]|nr:phenylalanine--tRNA ligase subunit beta [Lentisphaeria bacterium]
MKTSLKWLSNYIDLPWDDRGLADNLTLAGLEVEGIETVGGVPEGVVAGKILSRDPHPNADKLSVCGVTVGGGDSLQIVCGAPNCDAGKIVPVATIGTEFEGGFTIKKTNLRGVASNGMMCSARELGLGEGHEGLLELPADTPVGKSVATLFEPDAVIDWEITPNRPDWASHYGIAREIAAVADSAADLRLPPVSLSVVGDEDVSDLAAVEVLDPDLCPRYTARIVRDVIIGPSPEWLAEALRSVGLRPINTIVDITNYVMLECGQPLHAFDYDALGGHKIIVRRAEKDETLTTLDGSVCELTEDNLVIADADRAVALAGVMGGANSEISTATTTVLLEAAVFNASNVRQTARTHGFHTDSSYRFERGVDIDMTDWASRRACALMCEHAGGKMVKGVIDVYPAPRRSPRVTCRVSRVNQLLGTALTADVIAGFFRRLGLEVVENSGETVTVAVPAFRLDLTREVDLIEEVARLHGLNNLPAVPVRAVAGGSRALDTYDPVKEARAQLLALGLSEAMNYSLTSVEDATLRTGVHENELIKLSNPISAETGVMRPSLLSGLLRNVAHNIAHQVTDVAFFEIGRVIMTRPGVPEERSQVGIAMTGRRHPERFGTERETLLDFYDLKGILESWISARGLTPVTAAADHPAFRTGACAALTVDGADIAVYGEAAPELTVGTRLTTPLYIALVELDALLAAAAPRPVFTPLPQFPGTTRDISLVAPAAVSGGDIIDAIRSVKNPLLEDVRLFDVYEDAAVLGEGRRGLSYSLTYRDPAKTVTDKKVNKAHEYLKKALAEKLPVEYR